MIIVGLICLILLFLLISSIFYLIRFARIIMIIEDDFSDAIEALEDMSEVKNNKIAVNRVALKFVDRSKQKYNVVVEEEPDIRELQERIMRERILRGEMINENTQENFR